MLSFKEIEKKLFQIVGTNSQKHLAQLLGYNRLDTYQKALKKNSIPLKRILDFCIDRGLDATAILYGDHSGKEIVSREALRSIDTSHHHVIPYFSEVQGSCGDGCLNDSFYSEIILLPKERYPQLPDGLEAIKAFGDSMYPLIRGNSIILFKRVKDLTDIKNSCIYLYNYEGQLFIKILINSISNPKKVNSISLNQNYPMREIDKDKLHIVGEFVATI